ARGSPMACLPLDPTLPLARLGAAVVRLGEPVADAKLGQQDTRLGRVDLDLLADAAHKNPQIMRVVEVTRPPNLAEQLLVGDDLASMLSENLQQFVLLARRREPGRLEQDG